MSFSFRPFANRRALIGAAVIGATLGLAPVAAHIAAGRQAEAPRAVRVPITPTQEAARATAAKAPALHHNQLLLTAYGREAATHGLRTAQAPVAAAPAPFRSSRSTELDCLTQAVYFEARGETAEGQAAVAQVVLNRVRHPAFPKTVCGVVYQGVRNRGCQFSFACDGSVRRGRETSAWNRAHRVAARALAGAVMPEVGSATHFHALRVNPSWGPGLRRVAQVGLHVFYRLGRAPSGHEAPSAVSPADAAAEVVFTSLKVEPAAEAADVEITTAAPGPSDAAPAPAPAVSAEPAKPAPGLS